MDLYFEPKTKKSFGLGELLDAAMSGTRNKTEESEIATIEDSVTKTVSETKSVSESQLKTKTRSTFVYDEDEYAPRRTYRKKKHIKHNKYKKIHETSLLERIGDGIARILALPFKALFGSKNVTTYQAKDIQSKSIEIRKTKQANIENSKKIQKSFAPQQNQVEVKRLELEKIEELKRLQKTFEQQLNRYKNMFTSDDIKPDLSFFSYQKLPYDELKELLKVLDACIAHQKIIISLKKKFLHKACTYSNQEQNENIHRKNVNDIDGPHYTDKQNYKKNLDKMYQKFLENSKKIETPILDFNQISNNFFARAKSSIEEIFEMKKKWYFKYLERIPKLGLVPKSIRVTGQINLTRCIMKDYKDVTEKYVTRGMNPMIQRYNKQYNKIKGFTERYKNILNEDDLKYTNTILAKVSQVRAKHLESYKKLFDIFTKGGCNISNICNTVRLQGLISLVTKTIATFGSPF